jgi:hypothetical protein
MAPRAPTAHPFAAVGKETSVNPKSEMESTVHVPAASADGVFGADRIRTATRAKVAARASGDAGRCIRGSLASRRWGRS